MIGARIISAPPELAAAGASEKPAAIQKPAIEVLERGKARRAPREPAAADPDPLRLCERGAHDDRGQSTAEYALVLLGAAGVALLLVAWATKTDKVTRLLNSVIDRVLDQQVGVNAPAAVREQVGTALRQALEDDPLLAEKLRALEG